MSTPPGLDPSFFCSGGGGLSTKTDGTPCPHPGRALATGAVVGRVPAALLGPVELLGGLLRGAIWADAGQADVASIVAIVVAACMMRWPDHCRCVMGLFTIRLIVDGVTKQRHMQETSVTLKGASLRRRRLFLEGVKEP